MNESKERNEIMTFEGIKNLAPVGPHIEGLIRFSYEESANGGRKQLPQFELLTRVHEDVPKVGEIPRMKTHPIADQLICRDAKDEGHRLITEIPIRFLGKSPESILTARYQAVDMSSGRYICCGNGNECVQVSTPGQPPKQTACAGPEVCSLANKDGIQCTLNCRMKVQVDGSSDPLAVFEFQSSGINTYRTLASKLNMLFALYGNLRGLPFKLTSWAKSSSQSLYQPFFVANIELRDGATLAETRPSENDPFNGVSEEGLERLEAAMLQMAKDSVFDLNGIESVVTTWTPAEMLNAGRVTAPIENGDVGVHTGLTDVVRRAKESINQAAASVGSVVNAAQKAADQSNSEKIVTPLASTEEPVSEPDETEPDYLCI
jgi:hypothetical protein